MVTITIKNVNDADKDAVSVKITKIMQDEQLNWLLNDISVSG